MAHSAVISCNHHLKQCFQTLKCLHKEWESLLLKCTPLISSLGNLGEQLHSLENVQLDTTPLLRFPDFQERLHFKLSLAATDILSKLTAKMDEFVKCLNPLNCQVASVFQFYERNTDTLDLNTCTLRNATSPSIADMLEWLQDAQSCIRQQYLKRKYLLKVLSPDDMSLYEELPKKWESLCSPDEEEKISDFLFRVSVFLDS